MSKYKVIGAVTEPITLAEARLHCRVDADTSDGHPDDSLIEMYISVAREYAENFTGLALGKKTIELTLDDFPSDEIELIGPASSVTSIQYYDAAGDLQTLDASNYELDDYSKPSYIYPAYAVTWPPVYPMTNAVIITYVTGYADDSDSQPLPFAAKAAILLMVGHLYENREDTTDRSMSNIPNGTDALLRPLRVRLGMA